MAQKSQLAALAIAMLSVMTMFAMTLLVGCQEETPSGESSTSMKKKPGITFQDEVETNVNPPADLHEFVFVNHDGEEVQLADYQGKKNVVLVFMRGFIDHVCIYCQAQTSRLVANYDTFSDLDTEILVVYPGEKSRIENFVQAVSQEQAQEQQEIPFPVLLDTDLEAVKFFDITAELAKPSMYILDKQGKVRFAHVGKTISDRPSIKALVKQLEQLPN